MELLHANEYFSTARERYWIRLRKTAEKPVSPLTQDPVFQEWRFCNVHREHDKTTLWFKEHVRQPAVQHWCNRRIPDAPSLEAALFAMEVEAWRRITEATIAFRWFNRIETCALITDLLVKGWNSETAQSRLRGVKPVVNGAYIIKGVDGMPKMEGIVQCIDWARELIPSMVMKWHPRTTLQQAWNDLQDVRYFGKFMAYEVVTDLRHTPVLYQASDILTWANAGPGCTRGLGRVVTGQKDHFSYGSDSSQREMQQVMQRLLELSRSDTYWPQDWEPWEMREAEHWSCEFDKYCRVKYDGERMKQRYRS